MRKLILFVALLLAVSAGTAFAAPMFQNLGTGESTGMAAGGVVAYNQGGHAKIWSPANSSVDLGTGNTAGLAWKGSTLVVAGNSVIPGPKVNGLARRWDGDTAGNGSWTTLPQDGDGNWTAYGIAATATEVYVAGDCYYSDNQHWACWYKGSTNTTVDRGMPSGGWHNDSYFLGIAQTGTMTGWCWGPTGVPPTGGAPNAMAGGASQVILGTLYGNASAQHAAHAKAISATGNRVVGYSDASGATQRQAVYWNSSFTTNKAPVGIPLLPGYYYSGATAISPNGSIIGGLCYRLTDDALACWIWDAVNGTRNLATVFAAAGIDLSGWTSLTSDDNGANGPSLSGISDDGKWFTGTGIKGGVNTAWVAFVPEPSSFAVLALGLLPLLRLRRRS